MLNERQIRQAFSEAYVEDRNGEVENGWKLYHLHKQNSKMGYWTEWKRASDWRNKGEVVRFPISMNIENNRPSFYSRNDLADITYQHCVTVLNDNCFIVEMFGNGTPEFAPSAQTFLIARKLPKLAKVVGSVN